MKSRSNNRKPIHPILTGLLGLIGVLILGLAVFLFPPVNSRLGWRAEYAGIYLKNIINPAPVLPTPKPQPAILPTETAITPISGPATVQPQIEIPTAFPTVTPTAIPDMVRLPSPPYEHEDLNNCGPAALSMNLKVYGWQGDQYTISDVIKPIIGDRNVNVEELQYYVRNFAGYLKTEYRVGGTIELLKKIIAAGIPVMIEEGYLVDKNYWPNDDRWAGHYLLINGYNDANQTFLTQDVFVGPDIEVTYTDLDKRWQSFNRVYIMVYPAEREEELKQIVGEDWDVTTNRQNALETAKAETESDPQNVYAWFNLGTNQVYFERYADASLAYDKAREIGFPHRMLRYQFGPFLAYFHSLRTDDLRALTEYALYRTPNSEEALLWEGWALYRLGKNQEALEYFQKALDARPGYADAEYALNFVRAN